MHFVWFKALFKESTRVVCKICSYIKNACFLIKLNYCLYFTHKQASHNTSFSFSFFNLQNCKILIPDQPPSISPVQCRTFFPILCQSFHPKPAQIPRNHVVYGTRAGVLEAASGQSETNELKRPLTK